MSHGHAQHWVFPGGLFRFRTNRFGCGLRPFAVSLPPPAPLAVVLISDWIARGAAAERMGTACSMAILIAAEQSLRVCKHDLVGVHCPPHRRVKTSSAPLNDIAASLNTDDLIRDFPRV